MTRVFDGMATSLNSIFGDVVTVTLRAGLSREIQAIVRENPAEVAGQDGVPVETVVVTMKAHASDIEDIERGDIIVTSSGDKYRYVSRVVGGSPANDAFVEVNLTKD